MNLAAMLTDDAARKAWLRMGAPEDLATVTRLVVLASKIRNSPKIAERKPDRTRLSSVRPSEPPTTTPFC